MSPETPLCPTSIGRDPQLLGSGKPADSSPVPAGHMLVLALLSVPCGVQAEPRSRKPHFHQVLRYRLPFPAPLVSMGTCLDGQDFCSGSWLVEVTSVETRLLGFDIISLRDLTLDTYLLTVMDLHLFFFPDVRGRTTFWQRFISHLHLCQLLRTVVTFSRS